MSSAEAHTENWISLKPTTKSKQNKQASLPSTSTKVASTIVSCDLQSRLWMRLYSGWAAFRRTDKNLLTDTWNRGTRGTDGHEEHEKDEEHEDTRWSQNEINAMATLHRYKRGHTPRIQKGLKRPTLAWNKTKCSLLQSVCPISSTGWVSSRCLPEHWLVQSFSRATRLAASVDDVYQHFSRATTFESAPPLSAAQFSESPLPQPPPPLPTLLRFALGGSTPNEIGSSYSSPHPPPPPPPLIGLVV